MRNIIKLGPDDFGVYIQGCRNSYGTPLAARGSWDFVTNLNIEAKFSGSVIVYAYDPNSEDRERYLPPEDRGTGELPIGERYNYPKIIDGKDLCLR